jgi:maltose/moltooligosaccharide transporter
METIEKVAVEPAEQVQSKKLYTNTQLLNFCLGFFGLQFAWQMRIILSGPVTEGLGAAPWIFGLIWLAGPCTGMIVQPIIGAMSDKMHTRFGRRRPFLLIGAVLASLALWGFPNSSNIVNFLSTSINHALPVWSALLLAAIMIWAIDASVNAAQGPYRAMVPDNIPQEQHSLANSYLSFAIGLGSVIAAGTAPFLKWAFDYQMSITSQFVMASLAFSIAMLWTCFTTKEEKAEPVIEEKTEAAKSNDNFINSLVGFFTSSPEVSKICVMQLFTWVGVMSMFIFFTNFAIHNVFAVPDLANTTEAVKKTYEAAVNQGINLSSISFAIFNLICFVVSIPIGILSSKFGNKKIHAFSLAAMAVAFFCMSFTTNVKLVSLCMAVAGIGWASILALPFAMLTKYIKKGTEGSVMGIFNIFIAGPQVLVCTLLAWFINQCPTVARNNYHWEYAFLIGAVALFAAAIVSMLINEDAKVNA